MQHGPKRPASRAARPAPHDALSAPTQPQAHLPWSPRSFNAVRPISAIRHLYPDTNVTAYSADARGTSSFPGRDFNSYLRTMPHADYPSITSCVW